MFRPTSELCPPDATGHTNFRPALSLLTRFLKDINCGAIQHTWQAHKVEIPLVDWFGPESFLSV